MEKRHHLLSAQERQKFRFRQLRSPRSPAGATDIKRSGVRSSREEVVAIPADKPVGISAQLPAKIHARLRRVVAARFAQNSYATQQQLIVEAIAQFVEREDR